MPMPGPDGLLIPASHRQLRFWQMIQRRGTDITFNGVVYRVGVKIENGANVGTQWIDNKELGTANALFDPHRFVFPALYFDPYTYAMPPASNSQMTWHLTRTYTVTNVTPADEGADTLGLFVFAYRSA